MTARWNAAQPVGAGDTRRAAGLLAARLPSQLATFAHLAYDFACFWQTEGRALFAEIDPHGWERCERNPVRMLEECPAAQLVRAAQDPALVARAEARSLIPYLADAVPGWFQATLALKDADGIEGAYSDDHGFDPDPVISCRIPADGEYILEIHDAIYRGREDFVYRITMGALPFVTSVFPM